MTGPSDSARRSTEGAGAGVVAVPREHDRAGIARRVRSISREFRVEAVLESLPVASLREREILSECLIEWASPRGRPDEAHGGGARAAGLAWVPLKLREFVGAPLRWRRERALACRDEAVRAIAASWESIPKEHRGLAIAACSDRFEHALAGLGTSADPQARRSLALLMGEMGLGARGPLLELLATLVPDRDERVSDAAHASMLRRALRAGLHELACIGVSHAGLSGASVPGHAGLGDGPGEAAWGVMARALETLEPGWERGEGALETGVAQAAHDDGVHVARAVSLAMRGGGVGSGARDLAVAALIAARPGEPERIVLMGAGANPAAGENTSASLSAIRGALRSSKMPLAALRAVRWLGVPSLRRAAIDRLVSMETLPELGLVLAHSHLLLRASRTRSDEAASRAAGASRGSDARGARAAAGGAALTGVSSLPTLGRLGLWRFLDWRGDGAPARTAAGVRLLADRDASVRHAAARGGTRSLTLDLMFDVSEGVARHAFLRMSPAGSGVLGGLLSRRAAANTHEEPASEADSVLTRVERSAHESVRAMAAAERVMLGSVGDGLATRVRVRRWIAADRDQAITKLASDLSSGRLEACERAAFALRVAADASVVLELRDAILVCVERWRPSALPGARRLVAGLATLLGVVPTAQAPVASATLTSPTAINTLTTLTSLTTHEDARVGANAVEALGRHARQIALERTRPTLDDLALTLRSVSSPDAAKPLAPTLASRFHELRADPRHRVRANAIRALIEGDAPTGSEVESLVAMIEDPRPAHRLAGVWVLWRELPSMAQGKRFPRWSELAARVVRLQGFDVDERVRRRASACVARLSMATGGAWEGAA